MPPEWISSDDQFLQFVLEAHREAVNASSVGTGGRGVHIGIVDSMAGHLHADDVQQDIRHERSFVDSADLLTTTHGLRVFRTVSHFSPKATFSFYQVITDDGQFPLTAFRDAITATIEDGVDIINLSAGQKWYGPPDDNPYSREINRATEEGITVVAAAGNHLDNGDKPPVFHPAANERTISVGGFVTTCPCSPDEKHDQLYQGPYYIEDEIESAETPADPNEVYCSYQGCVGGGSCFSNQTIKPWPGNPNESFGGIDIMAPVLYPYNDSAFGYGSSFAAPIVSGTLAESIGNLQDEGYSFPDSTKIKKAVEKSAMALDEGEGKRLDAWEMYCCLEEHESRGESSAGVS